MQLQHVTAIPYPLLPSGLLIVEPHLGLLSAKAAVVAAAECHAATSCKSGLASCVPVARIMIFGNAGLDREDHLYHSAVEEHCRPEALLYELVQRTNGAPTRYRKGYRLLDGDGGSPPELGEPSPKRIPAESDPSHLPLKSPLDRERPGDESPRRRDL